jgi:hypothetical protein
MMRRMTRPRTLSLTAAAAAAALLAGCGGSGGTGGGARPATATTAAGQHVMVLAPLPGVPAKAERTDGKLRVALRVDGTAAAGATVQVSATGCAAGCAQDAAVSPAGAWAATLSVPVADDQRLLSVRAGYAGQGNASAARVDVPVDLPVRPGPRPSLRAEERELRARAAALAKAEREGDGAGGSSGGASKTLILVGDSLSEGQQPLLERALPGWRIGVSAEIGRHLAEGMRILGDAELPATGTVVAVGLFTNDDPWRTGELAAAVKESLRVAGPTGCAIWATIASPPIDGRTYDDANRTLLALARSEPRLRVVPWEQAATAAGVLGGDGVHPDEAGAQLRATLFARAARSCRS